MGTTVVIDGDVQLVQCIDGEVGEVIDVGATIPAYQGAYVVDPKFAQQILETRDKRMTDDVTVKAIQLESVTNPSGGQTVYIGGLIDGEF